MKFTLLSLLFIMALFPFAACDDDSSGSKPAPSPTLSTVDVAPSYYDTDDTALISEVTVTINDEDGNPMAGRFVFLHLSETDVTSDSTEVMTDEEGLATFRLSTGSLTETSITAYVGAQTGLTQETAVALDGTAVATFTMGVSGRLVDALAYTHLNGLFSMNIEVEDSLGGVEAALITVTPPETITLDATEATTDATGAAAFEATTAVTGIQTVDVEVAGIDHVFAVDLGFIGPMIGGNVSLGMSYPYFANPRAGAMAIRINETTGFEILGQLPGGSIIYDLPETGPWVSFLPIVPDSSLLTRDTDSAMDVGIFILTIFNDSNDNGVHDQGEAIIASKSSDGVLVFLAPDDPEGAPLAGWGFLDALEENPTLLDWDTTHLDLNMTVYGAPVREPFVEGSVAGPPADNRRTTWYVIDSVAFFEAAQAGNPFSVLLDPLASEVVLDAPIEADSTFSATAINPLEVLDAATINAWKYNMNMGGGETLSQLLILPVYYVDEDLSGDFNTGDTLSGFTRPPVGVEYNVSYILQYPLIYSLMSADQLWMHHGYNWWASPMDREVVTIAANGGNYDLELDDTLPTGWVDVDFVIRPADADEDATPVAVGTFSTAGTEFITTSTCTGCENATAGMKLVITENYERTEFLDWAGAFNLGPFN
ncbi:Ig-like domain-containing protein [Myxococcota bacterium]|nr:Ig-like domain-containing protein [Myxococcota bacterium]MBU1537704.1 Ig-like domain-containing protein [Myxococcota bacterium]